MPDDGEGFHKHREYRKENLQSIDVEFDTFAEQKAFMKGLLFEGTERVAVICHAGHYDDSPDERGKYGWSLCVHPL